MFYKVTVIYICSKLYISYYIHLNCLYIYIFSIQTIITIYTVLITIIGYKLLIYILFFAKDYDRLEENNFIDGFWSLYSNTAIIILLTCCNHVILEAIPRSGVPGVILSPFLSSILDSRHSGIPGGGIQWLWNLLFRLSNIKIKIFLHHIITGRYHCWTFLKTCRNDEWAQTYIYIPLNIYTYVFIQYSSFTNTIDI